MTGRSHRRAAVWSALVALLLATATLASPAPAAVSEADGTVEPRIVGGVEVDPPGKYPFVAALVRSSYEDETIGQYCGGSLIAPEWVITAGHCIPSSAAGVDVLIGRHDLADDTQGERIGAVAVYRHPAFDLNTLANDVGLIRLERAATAGTPISLATPADASAFAPGVWATVVGWGETQELPPGTPAKPTRLREADLPIVSDIECALAWGDGFIFPDMLCAGGVEGVDACVGDSGGPLFVAGLQVGIVSGGTIPCAQADRPGLYTRVAIYEAWVAGVMEGAPPPPPPPPEPDYYCQRQPATIVGTPGDDVIFGTAGDDVIVALGGDDVVWGLRGDDFICLGSGHDRAYGGPGNDIIRGRRGNDYIEGNRGDDLLVGGAGADVLLGGEDDDVVHGNGGDDELYGLAGNDRLMGGPGDDYISGGVGDDELRGADGYDVLIGGEGVDVCFAGEEVDCEHVFDGPLVG